MKQRPLDSPYWFAPVVLCDYVLWSHLVWSPAHPAVSHQAISHSDRGCIYVFIYCKCQLSLIEPDCWLQSYTHFWHLTDLQWRDWAFWSSVSFWGRCAEAGFLFSNLQNGHSVSVFQVMVFSKVLFGSYWIWLRPGKTLHLWFILFC